MKATTETYREFYKLMCCDTSIIDGQSQSNMIDCILYVDFRQKKSDNVFIMNIERFRYKLNSSYLQQAELDLWRRLALSNDKVSLLLNDKRELIGVIELNLLQKKVTTICKEINMMYKGEEIENLLENIIHIYSNEELLISQFVQYNLFGSLLLQTPFYNRVHRKQLNSFLYIPGHDGSVNSQIEFIALQNENLINPNTVFNIKGINNDSEETNFKLQNHSGTVTFSNINKSILSLHIKIEFLSEVQVKIIRECKLRQLQENDLIYLH